MNRRAPKQARQTRCQQHRWTLSSHRCHSNSRQGKQLCSVLFLLRRNGLRSQGLRWLDGRQHVAVTRGRNRIRQVTLLSGLVQ